MNNDYLRVNSKDEREGIVEGVYAAKQDVSAPENAEPTLYTFLSEKKSGAFDFHGELPNMTKALSLALIFVSLFALLILAAFTTKNADFLVLSAFSSSISLPAFFIYLFYRFNTMKNVAFAEIVGGFVIGAFYCLLINTVRDRLVEFNIAREWIAKLAYTASLDVGLIILGYFYVKLLKKVNLFASLLLVICVYCGFAFVNSFTNSFSALFVSARVYGEEQYGVFAIIRSEEYFSKTVTPFIISTLKYGFYEAVLFFLWSLICGGIIALKASPLKSVYKDGSLYVLIVLQFVLHALKNVGSLLTAIDIIINVVCVFVSFVTAFKMLNFIISKNPHEKTAGKE